MRARILMVVFVLVLGSILTGALVVVNSLTAPVIARNEEMATRQSILEALGIPYGPGQMEEVYSANVQKKQADGVTYYVSKNDDVAFHYSGPGLWGPIEGYVAVGPDFETLVGITITVQEETPGLGGRIAEASYLAQFKGKDFARGLRLVSAGRSRANNEIDAITGATLSSNAFVDIVNKALKEKVPVIEQGESR